jgi:hypothetical protein
VGSSFWRRQSCVLSTIFNILRVKLMRPGWVLLWSNRAEKTPNFKTHDQIYTRGIKTPLNAIHAQVREWTTLWELRWNLYNTVAIGPWIRITDASAVGRQFTLPSPPQRWYRIFKNISRKLISKRFWTCLNFFLELSPKRKSVKKVAPRIREILPVLLATVEGRHSSRLEHKRCLVVASLN